MHIVGLDHPESVSVGPSGEAYTTGTGGQVYRIDLDGNQVTEYASTAPHRVLGQAVDAGGFLYCADTDGGVVIRIAPDGTQSLYATGPRGARFVGANYPVFDRHGFMYLSDSGDWSDTPNGAIYRIRPGGGEAEMWCRGPLDTPNAIALDAESRFVYFVETWGAAISRVAIEVDGSAGAVERVVELPLHVPDGLAFDERGRIWIACHRPDSVKVYDLRSQRLHVLAQDWQGRALRAPTDLAFAGPRRDVLLVTSLGNLCMHRFDGVGARGLALHFPHL